MLEVSCILNNNFELRIFTEKETNKEFFSVVNWEYEQPSEDSCYIVTSQVKLEKTKYWDWWNTSKGNLGSVKIRGTWEIGDGSEVNPKVWTD